MIKRGNIVTRLAKLAPAPIVTNSEGSAQQIKVDDDANKDIRLADLSFIFVKTFRFRVLEFWLHSDH